MSGGQLLLLQFHLTIVAKVLELKDLLTFVIISVDLMTYLEDPEEVSGSFIFFVHSWNPMAGCSGGSDRGRFWLNGPSRSLGMSPHMNVM